MACIKDYYTIPMDEGPVFTFQPEKATEYQGDSWLVEPPEEKRKVRECPGGIAKGVYNQRQDLEKEGTQWRDKDKSFWVKKVFRGTF